MQSYESGGNSADYNAGLPVVAFTLSDKFKKQYPHVQQAAVSISKARLVKVTYR
jgi:glutamate decarboxylase